MKKKIVAAIYVCGVCLVVFFLAMALIGGDTIKNPDAMVPYTEFERNMFILAIGFLPMVISCIALIRTFSIKSWGKRILVLIPAIVAAVPFTYCAVLFAIMLVQGFKDATAVAFKK